jgi:hypothetical protein
VAEGCEHGNSLSKSTEFIDKISNHKLFKKNLAQWNFCMYVCIHTHKYITTQRTITLILTNKSWWQGFITCNGRISFLPPCPSQAHSPSNLLLKAFALRDKAAGA